MTANDGKIIKKYPEATPYDLLTKHGLSQGGYEELLAKASGTAKAPEAQKEKTNLLVPAAIKENTKHRIEPNTSVLPQRGRASDAHAVRLKENSTGKEFTLSQFAADRWLRKHGTRYTKMS